MSSRRFRLYHLSLLWSFTTCSFAGIFLTVEAFPIQLPSVIHRHSQQTTIRHHKGQQGASLLSHSSATSIDNDSNNDKLRLYQEERFSVAPMMGHTHRHYHYYFRHFSHHATLYTEMIPAAQVVTAYQQQFQLQNAKVLSVNQVLDLLHSSNTQPSGGALDSLLQMAQVPSTSTASSKSNNNIVLQLGGKDPHTLALASAIGSHYGYTGINLNCGCPSNAVAGGDRSGGAALMREPSLVAHCLERMSQGIDMSASYNMRRKPTLSVKHRLGVHDAATYDAKADRERSDGDYQAFLQCRDFIRTISLGGDISKIQVHARLGLLGEFDPGNMPATTQSRPAEGLWVPGGSTISTSINENQKKVLKVDHKRLQYKARKTARQATIQNRSVPPLRPYVVEQIAAEFPQLQVITNGGIRSMKDVEERVPRSPTSSNIVGAMVGRAVINHPCAFGAVDSLWETNDRKPLDGPTREAVLLDYIQYCQREEEVFLETESATSRRRPEALLESLAALRRRLVAVPFHLFAGEVGNEEYQRRIRKLIARAERHTSAGIMAAALSEVPIESASKPVNQHSTEMKDIPIFQSSSRRAGPLQRTIF